MSERKSESGIKYHSTPISTTEPEAGEFPYRSEFAKTGHRICAVRLGYMDYGMTYKINEKFHREIVKNIAGKKFISIEILGERILEIIKSKVSDVNGKIYEIA